ncbi:Eukaryotic translation initiation factor 5A [Ceratobasidium sp. 395]|nr:Eukaryotic translation initiation factor 5A [Ceratobasidium sp. 395]
MQCSALRKNGHVVIKGRPCKIVDMSTSKTGKHGHAKVHLVAIDIFTGKKLEDISPSTHNMDVPNVSRTEYQLVNVDDGFLNLMNQDGVSKDDVKVPEGDIGKQIQDDFEAGKELLVTIVSAMGEEQAIAVKEAPKGNCTLLLLPRISHANQSLRDGGWTRCFGVYGDAGSFIALFTQIPYSRSVSELSMNQAVELLKQMMWG